MVMFELCGASQYWCRLATLKRRSHRSITSERLRQRIRWIRPQHGFTLVELIVMMIVIAILAVAVVPRFSLLSGFDEVGYRDKVKATLEFARKSAVAQRRYVCAVIDASYDLTLTIETAIPENHTGSCPYSRLLTLPAADKSCSGVTNKVCHPGNVTLTPAATILFDAQGRPVSGASTYTVTGDTNWPITVEAETGYVH